MSDSNTLEAKTLRDEVIALFGLRWDTLVEWVIISWLSLWFWTSVVGVENGRFGWSYGPLTGIQKLLESLDLDAPSWFAGTLAWLLAPGHSWLSTAFVVIAIAASVTAVRSYRLSGLRTIALASAAVVCEIVGSFWPVAWILLYAAIPAAIACILALVDGFRNESKFTPDEFYSWEIATANYVTKVVMLFLAPVLAPMLLAAQLVVSFRTSLPYDPIEELNQKSIAILEAPRSDDKSRLEELAKESASVSLQLAGNQSSTARRIATRYLYRLSQRQQAESQRARAERNRRSRW